MAITYIVGNPGSGKSYLAVYKIWEFFYKNKKKKSKIDNENLQKYKICYTNINEFKFNLFDNVLEFDFNDLMYHLTNLYTMYQNKENDQKLLEYCENNSFKNALFVIDEVHNIFKKNDEILIWWLTYHRHLYHDLFLITQDLSLVPNEYKRIAEFFYKAVDSGKRLFSKKFRYIQYSNYRMYQNSIIQGGALNIPFSTEIFNLYHSGNDTKIKSFVQKYLIFAFLLVLIAICSFIYTLFSFGSNVEKEKAVAESNFNRVGGGVSVRNGGGDLQSGTHIEKEPLNNYKDGFAVFIVCYDNFCEISKEYEIFPMSYLMALLENYKPIYSKRIKSINSIKYFFVFKENIFTNLMKNQGVSYEKNSDFNIGVLGSDTERR
ncbi:MULTISPECIES: zonular occludens toxin domain-containing protein [unclassified Campylobacter]|uniref:zonular occludens toxin domain-containing protein n=1 Tax=unclassified Campylobacter TaxID=2593542 RepID=UPI0022E999D2|nr:MULTISPECIES: zonular occludens toxin domain-containing protein [unclassified Campylobacter]MDA3048912.1 zonular occludens toxin domain-containing protein [Campylobacter sp. JMF_15 NE4]MDA3050377.1 zonular occludens toxin domain-containing protein [Campylobacter sp. JMF_02 ED1]MDA3054312.1 zonular occludens toxin domain-containing protein [Campylobacter sp. VBCF_07 NA4]MDA3061004.1 zonular occludens toxin domain-containing protein [Campylobacter sp. VBCF_02 NA5]MDA3070518.1 zonular occluden